MPLLPALLLLLSAVLPARAAGGIERLTVRIWPEYDRAGTVLVMLDAGVTAAPGAPVVRARIPVPAAVGEPHAVAFRDDAGRLMLARYTRTVEGDVAWLDVEAGSPALRVEYYAPIDTSRPERSFRWTWPGALAVGALSYEVMAPPGATGLEIAPPPASQAADEDGQVFHLADLGAVAAGQGAEVSVRYVRADDRPAVAPAATAGAPPANAPATAATAPVEPAGPAAGPPAASGSPSWVYVVGIAIVVLAAIMLLRPGGRE